MKRIVILAATLVFAACATPQGPTTEEVTNSQYVRAENVAYNAQADGWLDAYAADLADDLRYWTMGPWAPTGQATDRAGLIESMRSGARLFPDRKSTILDLIASDDIVVTEVAWSGTASAENPALEEGQQMELREVVIYKFRNGKLVELREFALPLPTR